MDKVKTTRSQQQTSSEPSVENSNKAAKGYPAVARFAQAPAPSADGGNELPHQLQQGVEALSGMSMAGTSVHYNSSAPAQIGALAYAAGNQIHLGPGQEQHLPHEAWHIVQQKQGRVKPTLQAKGLAINDDHALETEADVMGQRAAQLKTTGYLPTALSNLSACQSTAVVQRKIGFEFQAVKSIFLRGFFPDKEVLGEGKGGRFTVECDGGLTQIGSELEVVTKAFDETADGREKLVYTMDVIIDFLNNIKHNRPIKDTPGVDWNSIVRASYDLSMWKFRYRKKRKDEKEEDYKKSFQEEETKNYRTIKRIMGKLLPEEGEDVPKFVVSKTGKHFHPQATVGVKFENIANLINYLTKAPIKRRGVEIAENQMMPPLGETKETVREEDRLSPHAAFSQKESKELKHVDTGTTDLDQRLTKLASVFGWGGKKYHVPYKAAWTAALSEVNRIPHLSPRVKGLAVFFYGLAKNRSEEFKIGDPGLTKQAMPFMLRNGLLPLFDTLTEGEVRQLKQIVGDDTWNKKIVPGSPHSIDDFDHGEIPTVRKIFDELLINRNDFLQKEKIAGHGEIKNSPSSLDKFGMTRVDDIGISDIEKSRRQGAIIELRKLGSEVAIGNLKEFALAVFDLTRLINATPADAFTATDTRTGAAPAQPPSEASMA
ncbi:MAG: DUF4157 domain-containing protein [Bacteroidota bacterium]